jgi:hypothetical protein
MVAALIVATLVGIAVALLCPRAHSADLHSLRLAKCRVIAALYDDGSRHDFYPWCGTLLAEHEKRGEGFAECYWWSLIYGASNFSLRAYATSPGACAGPMDVKHWPLVLDPAENIRWHVREMWGFYREGVRGRDLCEAVFLPAAPRDWGGGMFARTDRKHRAAIARAYREGRLPQ